jgi:hypothetical protein
MRIFPNVGLVAATGVVDAQGAAGPTDIATPAASTTSSNAPQAAPADAALESAAVPVFGTKILTIGSKVLKEKVTAVSFAAQEDYTELFDNVAFFFNEDGLYIGASDNRRMARVRVPPQEACFAQDNRKILVNCALLTGILKAVNANAEIVWYADDDYLTMSCVEQWGATPTVRIAMPPAKIRDRYPNIPGGLDMEFGARIEILNKSEMVNTLKTILQTSRIALIKADTGKNEIEIGGPQQ